MRFAVKAAMVTAALARPKWQASVRSPALGEES
jgi:hypothetical protein